MGSWIGGDRDGNPFVTADVLRSAIDRAAITALDHHLGALRRLGRVLSISDRLVTPSDELLALAAASGDESPFRADEPYRRALRGMFARLHAFAVELLGPALAAELTVPPPPVPRPPYAGIDELVADLVVVSASLQGHGAGALGDGRGRAGPAHRARRSAPTSPASTCARTRPCTRSSSPSCSPSPASARTTASSPSRPGSPCCAPSSARPAPCAARSRRTRRRPPASSPSSTRPPRPCPASAPAAIPHYVISGAAAASDVLEVAVLLREVGLVRPGRDPPIARPTSSRCSRRSATCSAATTCWRRCSTTRSTRRSSPAGAGVRR